MFRLLHVFCVVASHVEAWIEIFYKVPAICQNQCCLSCRGVNWNVDLHAYRIRELCCLSCRGVNWNYTPTDQAKKALGCLSCRGVNWNSSSLISFKVWHSCLSCRGVNWNRGFPSASTDAVRVASHVEAWIEIESDTCICSGSLVASHVEAWIEIRGVNLKPIGTGSCLSCRGVNWNLLSSCANISCSCCCLSCRGVNWNLSLRPSNLRIAVASHVEAWIEIFFVPFL